MTATTTPVDTRRRPLTQYFALAAVVLTITIGAFFFFTLTGSGSTATATDGSFYGDLPAMPH